MSLSSRYGFFANLELLEWALPPFLQGRGGLSLQPNFQKGGGWQDLDFYMGVAWKEGMTFFRRGLQILHKNKLKSEISNDKKAL